ncbi:uncharacterized protein TNCV_2202671 [Trichonephila clavipes]|nr:uncharacterized protein TNCV_2202671 [Trichonephila clavipes]
MNTYTVPHLVSLFQLRQLLLTTSRETANQCPSSLLFEKNELWTQLHEVAAVAEGPRYQIVAGIAKSSSTVPLKTRHVEKRCMLNLSTAQTSSRWCGVVVRKGSASSGVVLNTCPWFKITWSVAKSPRVAEHCDVNIHSHTQLHGGF